MCAVSAVGDKWQGIRGPDWAPFFNVPPVQVSRSEFEALRAELEEIKKELLAAKQEDVKNGEPDCEMEEKIAIFRKLSELFGIDFSEVFKKNES